MKDSELNEMLVAAGWSRGDRRKLIRNSNNGKIKHKKFKPLLERFYKEFLPSKR